LATKIELVDFRLAATVGRLKPGTDGLLLEDSRSDKRFGCLGRAGDGFGWGMFVEKKRNSRGEKIKIRRKRMSGSSEKR